MSEEHIEYVVAQLMSQVSYRSKRSFESPGGQSVGRVTSDILAVCDELSLEIAVGHHRSLMKNKEDARRLMEMSIRSLLFPKT